MDGRCATCRWWEADKSPEGWQRCRLTVMRFDNRDGIVPVFPESKARAFDEWESYGGALHTAPDFGCTQWTERVR